MNRVVSTSLMDAMRVSALVCTSYSMYVSVNGVRIE